MRVPAVSGFLFRVEGRPREKMLNHRVTQVDIGNDMQHRFLYSSKRILLAF